MSKLAFSLASYEGSILWKFFDGVSSAVSGRMLRGSPPGEENLTFLLCEMLDESATALHALDYPLTRAKEDLEKSDAGLTIDVEFQTHEHPKHIESKYSAADLGIVLSINHPILGQSRRAVLVQAKKLFPKDKSKEFTIFSEYKYYDRNQAAFLKELQERFSAWGSVFYLWYNPPSSGFAEPDAKVLRAYEANSDPLSPLWGHVHPFLDELIEAGFPFFFNHGGNYPVDPKNENGAREWRARQPALRISSLDTVLSLTENGAQPWLKALYDVRATRRRDISGFAPFADFFLAALASSRYGSSNEQWVQLAEGRKVPMPRKDTKNSDEGLPLDEFAHPPSPRHTITVSVRSTLPQIG